MKYLIIFASLLLPIISCMDFEVTQLDSKTAIYSEEVGKLLYYDSYWKVVTNIDLSKYEHNIKEIKEKLNLVNKLCELTKTVTKTDHCKQFTLDLKTIETNLQTEEYIIENFVQIDRQSREKRSLFNGVGKIIRTLFGNLDEDDALYFDEQMTDMDVKQTNTLNLIQNQTSLVRSTIHIIQDKFANTEKNLKVITTNLNVMEDKISRLTNYTNLNNVELNMFEELQELLTSIILETRLFQDEQKRLIEIYYTHPRVNYIHI